tara:strand:+ start:1424 stop:2407 length:984 start_codon:yes stop_codon:yes gene_type:complete
LAKKIVVMKCKKTKKEIFGYDGEVNVELFFNNVNNSNTACQFFKFSNITFFVEEGVINIEKTFTDEVMNTYLSLEIFPNLSARILSPYISDLMDPDRKSDKIILKEDNSNFWNPGLDWAQKSCKKEDNEWYNENLITIYKSLSVDLNTGMDYNENLTEAIDIDYPETTEITFYEIILKATLGKYRGYMELNFKNIKNSSDLKKAIESRLYENQEYEWSENPPFKNSFSSIYDNGIKAIVNQSAIYSGDADAYLNDMFYLLNNKRNEEIVDLFSKVSPKLSISDFDELCTWHDICLKKGYSTFKELIEKEFNTEELTTIGQKILESLS